MSNSPWRRMMQWGWSLLASREPKTSQWHLPWNSVRRIRRRPERIAAPSQAMEQRLLLTAQAVSDTYQVSMGQTLGPVNVMANDLPSTGLMFTSWSGQTTVPGLTLGSGGSLTYTPQPGAGLSKALGGV